MSNPGTLFEEDNVISLRTAAVEDNGNLVAFSLLPAWLSSSIPGSKPRGFDWASEDFVWLYRHKRPDPEEVRLRYAFAPLEQILKPIAFDTPPQFKFEWSDSGNSVALYLNGEPWAFIAEDTHLGYSKGILDPEHKNSWNQKLFEKIFNEDS